MKEYAESAKDWNIKTSIGPIAFNISVDYSFFNQPAQSSTERHKHATYEFHFITKGTGIISTDDMQFEAVPGSYYIVRSGVYHMQKGSAKDPLHRYSCKFDYNIKNNAGNFYSEEEIKSFVYLLSNIQFYHCGNASGQIGDIIYEIQSELVNENMGYYTKVQYLFSLLMINIIREMTANCRYEMKAAPRILIKDRIHVIDNFFDFNYSRKVTIQDLCKLVHLSKSQLNRILKEKYSMSFKQKHMEVQIEHAKNMLLHSDLSISAISEKIGYTSESNFTAFFKHETGMSPKEYRKRQA